MKKAGAKNVTRRKIREAVDAKIAESAHMKDKASIIKAPAAAAAAPTVSATSTVSASSLVSEEPELEPEPEPAAHIETIAEVLDTAKAGWGTKFAGVFIDMGIHDVQVKRICRTGHFCQTLTLTAAVTSCVGPGRVRHGQVRTDRESAQGSRCEERYPAEDP